MVSLVPDGCPELLLIGQDHLLKTTLATSTSTSNVSRSSAYSTMVILVCSLVFACLGSSLPSFEMQPIQHFPSVDRGLWISAASRQFNGHGVNKSHILLSKDGIVVYYKNVTNTSGSGLSLVSISRDCKGERESDRGRCRGKHSEWEARRNNARQRSDTTLDRGPSAANHNDCRRGRVGAGISRPLYYSSQQTRSPGALTLCLTRWQTMTT